MLGVESPRHGDIGRELPPIPVGEPRFVRKVKRDGLHDHRGIGQHARQDPLVFLGCPCARRIDDGSPRRSERDRPPEQGLLERRHVAHKGPVPAGEAPSRAPEVALGGARRVHQDPIKPRRRGKRPPVGGHHEHIGVSHSKNIGHQPAKPLFSGVDGHKATAVLHALRKMSGLATGGGTQIEYPLPRERTQRERGNRHDGLLDLEEPEPVLQRLRHRMWPLHHLSQRGESRHRFQQEALRLKPSREFAWRDPPGSHAQVDGLGGPIRRLEGVIVGDDVPVALELGFGRWGAPLQGDVGHGDEPSPPVDAPPPPTSQRANHSSICSRRATMLTGRPERDSSCPSPWKMTISVGTPSALSA